VFSVAWPVGSRAFALGVSKVQGGPVQRGWFVTAGGVRDTAQSTAYSDPAQAAKAITVARTTRKAASTIVGGLRGVEYVETEPAIAGTAHTESVWLVQSGSHVFELTSLYPANSSEAASAAQTFAQSLKVLH